MQRSKEVWFFLFFAWLCCSCAKDKLETIEGECIQVFTFVNQIKPIVDRSCAFTGCHDGSGSAPGNFRTYEGLLPYLEPGKFDTRAVIQRDMPPAFTTGSKMSTEDIMALMCWIENDYQER